MEDSTLKVLGSMVCITSIQIIAMIQGINGQALSFSMVALAGLGGYSIKAVVDNIAKRKKTEDKG